jgi:hypothetical protein
MPDTVNVDYPNEKIPDIVPGSFLFHQLLKIMKTAYEPEIKKANALVDAVNDLKNSKTSIEEKISDIVMRIEILEKHFDSNEMSDITSLVLFKQLTARKNIVLEELTAIQTILKHYQ